MALHFHSLKVAHIRRDTAGGVIISFDVPPALSSTFQFQPGQNLALKVAIDGKELRRTYSICTAPHEQRLSIAIKKVAGGVFSTYAHEQLKPGDTIDVLPPTGNFYDIPPGLDNQHYFALAAGSGITPIISIIKHILTTQSKSRFTLVYANQRLSTILFLDELAGLKNSFLERFSLIHLLSRETTETPVHTGRIDDEKLQQLRLLVDYKLMDAIFICGPQPMVVNAQLFFKQCGISEQKIHVELFNAPGSSLATSTLPSENHAKGDHCDVSIQLDGRRFAFPLAFNGEAILDTALKMGADLPYACKGGVCGTCKAQLLEGEVNMLQNYALGPGELEKGFILTCQSRPLTSKVVIDFDSR